MTKTLCNNCLADLTGKPQLVGTQGSYMAVDTSPSGVLRQVEGSYFELHFCLACTKVMMNTMRDALLDQ